MEISTVETIYTQINQDLHNRRVFDAIENIRKLIKVSGREYFTDQLEQHSVTYNNILKHSFGAIKDPQRTSVYLYLKRSLLEMADMLREQIFTEKSTGNVFSLKRQMMRESASERNMVLAWLENLMADHELSSLFEQTGVKSSDEVIPDDKNLQNVFNIIWLSDKYTESEIKLLKDCCTSNVLSWPHKCLIVSALTLSLLRFFDINKFNLLFQFVEKRENQVWERAFTGLFISFLVYSERFYLYPDLVENTRELARQDDILKLAEAIIIQFTKTRETEQVTKKWQEDILPAMMKIRPKLEEKLDLENILKDEQNDERNPDWETFFEDSPDLLDKLQQFTELQMEGMDVFISAFSQLKTFPFFHKISNWFIPFYFENPEIKVFIKPSGQGTDMTPLVQKLEKTHFMCNSDKYSFCINLGLIPDQQKTMMLSMASAEMDSIAELEKSEGLINSINASRNIFTQYFQDLYRFFKLHPWRAEFTNVFTTNSDVFENDFIRIIVTDQQIIRNIAEFYLDKKFFPYALNIFNTLLKENQRNVELFEKIAFCYEKIGDFSQALDFYKKAELIDTHRPWIIRKIAFCSKFLNRWEEALSYYRIAEKQNPEDLKIQADIGQCLIHLGEYEEALQYYFKIEVMAPENHKIRRPLAWCSFVLGKFDVAEDYLNRLLANDPGNEYDLLTLGHTFWCNKQEEKAIGNYLAGLKNFKNIKRFEQSFLEDKSHLRAHGITDFDIDLMIELIKSKIRTV